MTKISIAIFISGRGSNMTSLIEAAKQPDCPFQVVLVCSNKKSAAGLQVAQAENIETKVVDYKNLGKDNAEKELDMACQAHGVQLICLAGFMKLVSPAFVEKWRSKILNIHPSLLPKHPGLTPHEDVLAAGDTESGCTVHYVDEGMDTGDIIEQARVPVEVDDTPATLAKRVLKEEHKLYPKVVAQVARNC